MRGRPGRACRKLLCRRDGSIAGAGRRSGSPPHERPVHGVPWSCGSTAVMALWKKQSLNEREGENYEEEEVAQRKLQARAEVLRRRRPPPRGANLYVDEEPIRCPMKSPARFIQPSSMGRRTLKCPPQSPGRS